MWIFEIHLTNLAIGSPTNVAVPRRLQIRITNGLKPSICVKSCSQLVRQAFVLIETVLMRRADRLFLEALGIQFSALQARNLGTDQRRPVQEIRRAILSPKRELPMMGYDRREMLRFVID